MITNENKTVLEISPVLRPHLCYSAGAYRGAVVAEDPLGAGSVLCAVKWGRICSNSGDLSAVDSH